MSDYSENLILKYFDIDGDGRLSIEEAEKFKRTVALESAERSTFFNESKEVQEVFVELWCDKVLSENAESQAKSLEKAQETREDGVEELVI